MFQNRSEAEDHKELMRVIDNMSIAEPPCWSYPEAFFTDDDKPAESSGTTHEQVIAKSLCAGCEARFACAAYAIKWMPAGVWGGTTEGYRQRLRAQRTREAREARA